MEQRNEQPVAVTSEGRFMFYYNLNDLQNHIYTLNITLPVKRILLKIPLAFMGYIPIRRFSKTIVMQTFHAAIL